jgi:tetratricopeptide (TPR) repeat protein
MSSFPPWTNDPIQPPERYPPPGWAGQPLQRGGDRPGAQGPVAKLSRLRRNAAIVAAIALVTAPVAAVLFPLERGNWKIAAAMNLQLDGKLDEALAKTDEALGQSMTRMSWRRYRAELQVERGDYGAALADLNEVLESTPNDPRALLWRSQVYHHLGRHEAAIADSKRLYDLDGGRMAARSDMLNGLAYARAIGNRELDDALEDVNRALEGREEDPAYLDTRGFVYYRLGKYDQAEADMQKAVAGMELIYAMLKTASTRDEFDVRNRDARLREIKKSVAVLYYHYSLVLAKRGKIDKAAHYRNEVRELGFQPNEKLF